MVCGGPRVSVMSLHLLLHLLLLHLALQRSLLANAVVPRPHGFTPRRATTTAKQGNTGNLQTLYSKCQRVQRA
jgi:hypothetical protein